MALPFFAHCVGCTSGLAPLDLVERVRVEAGIKRKQMEKRRKNVVGNQETNHCDLLISVCLTMTAKPYSALDTKYRRKHREFIKRFCSYPSHYRPSDRQPRSCQSE